MTQIDFSDAWCIVPSSSGQLVDLAAVELQDVLRRITDQVIPVEGEPRAGSAQIILSHGDGTEDGFRWRAAPGRIELHGHNPRGLLYAAYSFLEALGCYWVCPGPSGERLPRGIRFDLPDQAVEETRAFPGRCLIVGHYAFMRDVEDWIIWAARNRMNTVFMHVAEGPFALAAAPESQWQAHKAAAVRLARQRGMTIEHGGHGLAALLPRRLYKRMPGAFRFYNGKRTPDHNLCPTSPEGLAIVREHARAYFRAHPQVDVFHLWPDDIPGGGWCACGRCRAYSSSEQALLVVNAVAEVLESVNPGAQIGFLAYMDTEDVPVAVTPRSNVCCLWAPRRRCYAHATDDPTCPVNVPRYAETLRAQVAHLRSAGAQPLRVFEYYLDAILFKSLLPPLSRTMQGDLRFYRDAGVHTIQALMTGDRPWQTPQLNAWLFARLAWNPDQDLDALPATFCRAAFGTDAAELPAYYRTLEAAFALALDVVPEQIRLEFDLDLKQLVVDPPADMGDPVFAPPEVLHRRSVENATILELLDRAARQLRAARSTSIPAAWNSERVAFDLTRAWLRFDLSRIRLYDAVAQSPIDPEARRHLDQAQAALNDVLSWGEMHLVDPRYRRNLRAMHLAMWQLRLDAIRARHFAGTLGGWIIRVRSLVQLAWVFLHVRGMYGA